MAAATGSVNGYLTSADWTTFNNKTSNTGTVTSVGGTGTVSGLTLTGTVTTSGNLTLGGTLSLTSLEITTGLILFVAVIITLIVHLKIGHVRLALVEYLNSASLLYASRKCK